MGVGVLVSGEMAPVMSRRVKPGAHPSCCPEQKTVVPTGPVYLGCIYLKGGKIQSNQYQLSVGKNLFHWAAFEPGVDLVFGSALPSFPEWWMCVLRLGNPHPRAHHPVTQSCSKSIGTPHTVKSESLA